MPTWIDELTTQVFGNKQILEGWEADRVTKRAKVPYFETPPAV